MRFKKINEKLVIIIGATSIATISLAITLAVYNVSIYKPNADKENDTVKEIVYEEYVVTNEELTEEQKIVAQNIIAKLDELEKNRDYSTSNSANDKKMETEISTKINNDENEENMKIETFAKAKEDKTFSKPIEGKIILDYSMDQLTYSKTLDEWRVHDGIDYEASIGDDVYATRDGKVSKMYEDAEYGYTLEIEHSDGKVSKYCGVNPNDNLELGSTVKRHDVIAQIASPTGIEAMEGSHLHFEIIDGNKKIKPEFN